MDIEMLNSLDRRAAGEALRGCCGSGVWVDRMMAARPFRDTTAMLTAAEEVWWDLAAEDWLEAFSVHGARTDAATTDYEQNFGYPYVAFSINLSDQHRQQAHNERLRHDPIAELTVSASELARITNRALRQLLELA